jgi:hypothetical protein
VIDFPAVLRILAQFAPLRIETAPDIGSCTESLLLSNLNDALDTNVDFVIVGQPRFNMHWPREVPYRQEGIILPMICFEMYITVFACPLLALQLSL